MLFCVTTIISSHHTYIHNCTVCTVKGPLNKESLTPRGVISIFIAYSLAFSSSSLSSSSAYTKSQNISLVAGYIQLSRMDEQPTRSLQHDLYFSHHRLSFDANYTYNQSLIAFHFFVLFIIKIANAMCLQSDVNIN